MLSPTGCRVLLGNTAGAQHNGMETIHYLMSNKAEMVANVVVIDLYRTDPCRPQEMGREWGMERTIAE